MVEHLQKFDVEHTGIFIGSSHRILGGAPPGIRFETSEEIPYATSRDIPSDTSVGIYGETAFQKNF